MESELQAITERAVAIWNSMQVYVGTLYLPSRIYQIVILVAGVAVTWVLRKWVGQRLRDWMRSLEGWPKWRLRGLLMIEHRLPLILYTLYAWLSTWIVQVLTNRSSRYFILELVAAIALAMLIASFASRLVRNRLLRRTVTWGLWVYIVLFYMGLINPVSAFLDAIAVQFGDFRLSVLAILKALVVLGIFLTAARLIADAASARVRKNDDISPSMQVLVVKLMQILLYSIAFFVGLRSAGFDLTGLAVLSGAIGIGVGFGLQKVVSNLVSGVIILLDKSIKPGDVISLGDTFGWVETLGARYVAITTRDGKEYLIPNEDLITGQVVNWTHTNDFVRLDIYFGCSYTDDPHEVRRVAIAAAKACPRVLPSRPSVCHIVGFGDSSVDYILRFWIRDPAAGLTNIRGDVYLALWDAFREAGISIPFPQREVRILGDKISD